MRRVTKGPATAAAAGIRNHHPPHRSRPRRQAARPRPLCCAVAATVPPLLEAQHFLLPRHVRKGPYSRMRRPVRKRRRLLVSKMRIRDLPCPLSLIRLRALPYSPFPDPAPSSAHPAPSSSPLPFPDPAPTSQGASSPMPDPAPSSASALGDAAALRRRRRLRLRQPWDHDGGATPDAARSSGGEDLLPPAALVNSCLPVRRRWAPQVQQGQAARTRNGGRSV
jgi:hypothetical protein